MCEWFDETVGQLVERLEQSGQAKNTLFVYVGDNGWIQQSDAAGYAAGSKQSPNEGGVRQPILLRWDGVIRPGDYPQLASSIDLMPTILSAADCPLPENLPGLDLLKLVRDGQPWERQEIFGESYDHDILDLDSPEATLLYRWVIRDRWKLILTYDGYIGKRYASSHPMTRKGPQLYDLLKDPHEAVNLAKSSGQETNSELSALMQAIEQWHALSERSVLKED